MARKIIFLLCLLLIGKTTIFALTPTPSTIPTSTRLEMVGHDYENGVAAGSPFSTKVIITNPKKTVVGGTLILTIDETALDLVSFTSTNFWTDTPVKLNTNQYRIQFSQTNNDSKYSAPTIEAGTLQFLTKKAGVTRFTVDNGTALFYQDGTLDYMGQNDSFMKILSANPSITTNPSDPLQCTDVLCQRTPNETGNGTNIQCAMTPVSSSIIGNRTIQYEGYCMRSREDIAASNRPAPERISLTPIISSSPQFQSIQGLPGNYQCYFRYCLQDGNGPELCLPWGSGPVNPTSTTMMTPQPTETPRVPTATPTISQTCTPRPACLDENPPCDAIESLDGWCTSAPYLLSIDAEYSIDSTLGVPTSNQMMWITMSSPEKVQIQEMNVSLLFDRSRTQARMIASDYQGIIIENQDAYNTNNLYDPYEHFNFTLKASNSSNSNPNNQNELVRIPFFVKDSGISLFFVPSTISVKLKSGEVQEWAVSPRYKQIQFYEKPTTTPSPSPDPPLYTCPSTEWLNCMPGIISNGIGSTSSHWQCTNEFIDWAKRECPGFQGTAH